MVEWQVETHPLQLLLLISWNMPDEGVLHCLFRRLLLAYPLDMIYRAYKWRWQVELLFTRMEIHYANLRL